MGLFDEDLPKKKLAHEIGSDLSLLSVDELTQRIALLNEEIARSRPSASANPQADRRPKACFADGCARTIGPKRRSFNDTLSILCDCLIIRSFPDSDNFSDWRMGLIFLPVLP